MYIPAGLPSSYQRVCHSECYLCGHHGNQVGVSLTGEGGREKESERE